MTMSKLVKEVWATNIVDRSECIYQYFAYIRYLTIAFNAPDLGDKWTCLPIHYDDESVAQDQLLQPY